jgi:cell division septum initiation protein DivIVA
MRRPGKPSDISKDERALRTDTAERLEAIVEAAERAAQGVIDDAEAQARRYLAQARGEAERVAEGRADELSDLVETLLDQAVALRQEAERLQATLEAARERIDPGPAAREGAPAQVEAVAAPRLRAVDAPDAPPEAERESSAGRQADPAGARLLATQLAVSGSSREEIAERLRNGFEIEDTDAILDAILGPEA